MTEFEKMIAGKIYDPNDSEIVALRQKAHRLNQEYNCLDETDPKREEILNQLIPDRKNGVYLQGPIYFDYGINCSFGENSYANFNFTVLDVCKVTIGDNVFMGPNVSIVPPIHPLRYQDRNIYKSSKGYYTDKGYAKPVTIKSNCWIASNVTICGGVTIGEGCVIGAGSVVTRSMPDNTLCAGNPCKVIRKITEDDKIDESLL